MILDAYNNPKTSAKYEQQIGELMIRTIRKEHDRIKQYKPDNPSPSNQVSANIMRERGMKAIMSMFIEVSPISRNMLFAEMRRRGLGYSRDVMAHTLITYRDLGMIDETPNNGLFYVTDRQAIVATLDDRAGRANE